MLSHRLDHRAGPRHDNAGIPKGPRSDETFGHLRIRLLDEAADSGDLWQAVNRCPWHDISYGGRRMTGLDTKNGEPAHLGRSTGARNGRRKGIALLNDMIGR
jgi:hypothetical protein